MTDERTFTESEIRRAVLTYSEGCNDGKRTFLRDAFDIEGECHQEFLVTVRVRVSTYDHDGDEIDGDRVAAEIVSLIDHRLADDLSCEDAEGWQREVVEND